jgi:site-specific DNA-methyltransferase (adenine-specific)
MPAKFQTGGIRRTSDGNPFNDVILSERTPQQERNLANHPSIKPQSFLRQVVYASLPLGEGIIVDTFMGSGSTVAAAEAVGVRCIGIERYPDYYEMSRTAIPKLAALKTQTELKTLTEKNNLKTPTEKMEHQQLTLW